MGNRLACLGRWLGAVGLACAPSFGFEARLELIEHLGHGWDSQLVHRTVNVAQQGAVFADRVALFRDSGECVPMQLDRIHVFGDGSVRQADVWFRTDLPANGRRTFLLRTIGAGAIPAAGQATDLAVVRNATTCEIRNSRTAVRIPLGDWRAGADHGRAARAAALGEHLKAAVRPGPDGTGLLPGPVLGVRLPSGRWTAPFMLSPQATFVYEIALLQPVGPAGPAGPVTGVVGRVLQHGPLFVRAEVVYTFENGSYTTTVTVRSQEPMVRLDERYDRAGALIIDLGAALAPTRALYKSFRTTPAGKSMPIPPAKGDQVALFVGWDFYFKGIAPAWALVGDPTGDVLGLVSTDPDWLPYPYNQGIHLLSTPDGALTAKASLGQGHRHWALTVATEAELAEPNPAQAFYRWWYRNVSLPLDKVANWQLVWPGMDDIAFPHTFFSAEELPAIRDRLRGTPQIAESAKQLKTKTFTGAAAALLVSGNETHLETLANPAARYVDSLPAAFLETLGCWDNSRLNCMQVTDELLQRYVGLELLLGSGRLTVPERRKLLTTLAFTQYVMDDLAYWPPNYDFSPQKLDEPYPAYVQGTPNQKICYITARGILGAVLGNHPEAGRWFARVLEEFDRVAAGSVAPGGAHVESPFYSSRDTMRFGPFWTALIRAEVGAEQRHRWVPRLANCYRYLGDMLTPPEPRFGGRRVYHPIGRSSSGVVDPTLMIACEPFGRDDADYCQRMRWCWEQQGNPPPGIMGTTGGRDISLTLLAAARMLAHEPSPEPPLHSVRWQGMGAVCRSRVGTDHESNVVFRHDPFCWNLYEGNNGAVYFYGKGAPLLPRFGGYWMSQKGQPNLMSIPFGNRLIFSQGEPAPEWTDGLGRMTRFAALGDLADFAVGVTRDTHWSRTVLFAKDLTRDDPVYLLVRDDVSRPGSASALHWWIMSKQVQPNGIHTPGVVPFKGSDDAWMANLGSNWQDAPQLTGQFHRFAGHFGVDLDVFIAQPTAPKIVTDAVGIGPGMPYAADLKVYESQQLLRLEQGPGKGYLTLFVPRQPEAPSPTYRTIADGAGIMIEAENRHDRLFLAEHVVQFEDEHVVFEGRGGFARSRNGLPLRLMVVDGRIAAGGITLSCTGVAAAQFDGTTVLVHCGPTVTDLDVQLTPELQGITVSLRGGPGALSPRLAPSAPRR